MRRNVKRHFFAKQGGFGVWLTTEMSREFQSPTNRMVRLYFLSCSDPAVLILQLLSCFTSVTLLTSHHLRVSREFQSWECSWMHTFDQFFTLSHIQPLHYSHLNTWFLIAKLQANLAQNKANTWLNKINLTIISLEVLLFRML